MRIQTITPFLFITHECRDLIHFVETKEQKHFNEFFIESKMYTEFYFYYSYLTHCNKHNLYEINLAYTPFATVEKTENTVEGTVDQNATFSHPTNNALNPITQETVHSIPQQMPHNENNMEETGGGGGDWDAPIDTTPEEILSLGSAMIQEIIRTNTRKRMDTSNKTINEVRDTLMELYNKGLFEDTTIHGLTRDNIRAAKDWTDEPELRQRIMEIRNIQRNHPDVFTTEAETIFEQMIAEKWAIMHPVSSIQPGAHQARALISPGLVPQELRDAMITPAKELGPLKGILKQTPSPSTFTSPASVKSTSVFRNAGSREVEANLGQSLRSNSPMTQAIQQGLIPIRDESKRTINRGGVSKADQEIIKQGVAPPKEYKRKQNKK
jgi:hypothetical protein